MVNLEIFDEYQRKVIKECLSLGIDPAELTKTYKYNSVCGSIWREGMSDAATCEHEIPIFNAWQMKEILMGLKDNLNVSVYTRTTQDNIYKHIIRETSVFDRDQMRELRLGLKANIDVTYYDNSSFNANQMKEIRIGLMDGLNVKYYADVRNDEARMHILRQMLKIAKSKEPNCTYYGSISKCAEFSYGDNSRPVYRIEKLVEILLGMLNGLDVMEYDSVTYDVNQMEEIRLGLVSGVDTSEYQDIHLNDYDMRQKRLELGLN